MPAGSSMTRFSTSPFCETSTTSARVGPNWMNSMCFSATSLLAVSTRPAPRDMPDSIWLGLGQHRLRRRAVAGRLDPGFDDAALLLREVAEFHEGVDEEAQPFWVGRRPAEMCGA